MASPEARRFVENADRARIFQENGKWYMRPYVNGAAAEIPERLARVARTGFRLTRNYGAAQPWGEEKEPWRGINCHRAALYAIGLIDRDDPEKGTPEHPDYQFSFFPLDSFRTFTAVEQLEEFLTIKIGGELGLVQVTGTEYQDGNPTSSPRLAHSFLAKANDEGHFVCFEKVNYSPIFHVVRLDDIFQRAYGIHGAWNAEKVSKLTESAEAQALREELNRYKK